MSGTNDERIRACLNVGAVLQNLETLPQVDPEMGRLCATWDVAVQFSVRSGPKAYVAFKGGTVRHGLGVYRKPAIKLYFISPKHLNAMFDGPGLPIPLKGFSRLEFLKNEFSKLTARLTQYLKPGPEVEVTGDFLIARTTMLLHTAMYAAQILSEMDDISRTVASHTPDGTLQVEVGPDGPYAHAVFSGGRLRVGKGPIEKPSARMIFPEVATAHALFSGTLDSFQAIGAGDLVLYGLIPLVDNLGLIFDRIERYMK